MKIKKIIITLFSFFLTAGVVAGQEIVSTTLSKDTLLIGDQAEWVSRLKVPVGMRAQIDSMSEFVVPGVELVGGFHIDTLKKRKLYSDVEARATITSFDSGSYVMPPLVVYFYEGENLADTLRLKEVPLEVTTVPIDTTTYQIADIRPQFKYPVPTSTVLMWIGIGLLAAAIIALIIWLIIRHRKNKPIFGKVKPKDPPHITALRNLEKIRNQKLWQNGKEKQFYTGVTDVIRKYIEDRYNIKTMERTSNEIVKDLSKENVKPEDFEEISDLFTTSDLVKFAKYTATEEENEKAIPTAVRFVNDTFLQEIEEDKKDE